MSNQVSTQELSVLDRYFKITERGSTYSREIRGGFVTFFAMSYIVVLNPLILGSFPRRARQRRLGHLPRSPRSRPWSPAS